MRKRMQQPAWALQELGEGQESGFTPRVARRARLYNIAFSQSALLFPRPSAAALDERRDLDRPIVAARKMGAYARPRPVLKTRAPRRGRRGGAADRRRPGRSAGAARGGSPRPCAEDRPRAKSPLRKGLQR